MWHWHYGTQVWFLCGSLDVGIYQYAKPDYQRPGDLLNSKCIWLWEPASSLGTIHTSRRLSHVANMSSMCQKETSNTIVNQIIIIMVHLSNGICWMPLGIIHSSWFLSAVHCLLSDERYNLESMEGNKYENCTFIILSKV